MLTILSSLLTAFSATTVTASTTTYNPSNLKQKLKMTNGETSPYFEVWEVKCEHCNANFPFDSRLVDILHKIRVHYGKPVQITSGYRCSVHNQRVGGVANSNHMAGRAADIWISGVSTSEIVRYAKTIGAGADTYFVTGSYAHIAVPAITSPTPPPVQTFKDPETKINFTRPTTNLSQGSTGEGVRWLQEALNRAINAGLVVDGHFGPATKAAVLNAQRAFGLTQDAIVGPLTRNALVARLR